MAETKYYSDIKHGFTTLIQDELAAHKHYRPFLTTVTFKFIPLSPSTPSSSYMFFGKDFWKQYGKVYRFIARKLDKNYHKKAYLQPKTYDFLDVTGSRGNPGVTFTETTIPHVHSVYLIHEQTLARFQKLADSGFDMVVNHESNRPFVSSIHAQPITDNLPEVVGYCSKFYDAYYARSLREDSDYELFRQHPLTADERQALKHEREALPFHMLVESMRDMKKRFRSLHA
jgi:hypothetical protein